MSDCCQQVAIDLVKNLLKISKEIFNFCYCWNTHLSTNPVGSRAHAMFLPIPTNTNFNQKQLVLIYDDHFLIWLWFDRLLYKWQGLALGQFWRCTCPSFQAEWGTKWFLKSHCNKKTCGRKNLKPVFWECTWLSQCLPLLSQMCHSWRGNMKEIYPKT